MGRKGGNAVDYDEQAVSALKKRAKELGLSCYSRMRKSELIDLLRNP